MIRGVSRQIIEVCKTQNEYFERALLFVNPAFSDAERTVLEQEARRMLREIGVPSAAVRRRKRWYLLLRMTLAAVAGSGITVAVFLLSH